MTSMKWMGLLVVASTMACNDSATSPSEGVVELGITRMEVTDTAHETTVRGFDATDHVVASLSLVHGTFTPTGPFRDEYNTPEIDGRKLDVDVLGKTMSWQTAGYTPTLHMPAHPPSAWEFSLFLESPTVKSLLDRWQIGWEHVASTEESPYTTGSYTGTNVTGCDGLTTCGTARTLPINTCGGGAAAIYASTATMTNPAAAGSQIKVAQCCPGGSGGQSLAWFATKTCPLSGTLSECGSSTGACKGCTVYSAWSSCSVTRDASHVYYDYTAQLQQPDSCGGCGFVDGASCGTFCQGVCKRGTCTLVANGGL